jgi:tRNA pseudouridine55 synthase
MGKRTKDSGIDGMLIIDKPAGMTSHDVVGHVRRLLKQRRAGHSGTLDPGATGVLLVGLGQCTRLLPFLDAHRKSYTADLVLGRSTATLDDEGETTEVFEMSAVTVDEVRAAAAKFIGDIEQIPPMVSAVRVDGKRLHQYAREGIEVERKPRPVTVYRYDVRDSTEPGVFPIDVECSTGTYVRTLVDDLGKSLGGGAHLRNLRRTQIGPFVSSMGHTLDDSLAVVTPLSAHEMLPHLPNVNVDAAMAERVKLGAVFDRAVFDGLAADATLWKVSCDDHLLAIYEPFRDEQSKPSLVLTR